MFKNNRQLVGFVVVAAVVLLVAIFVIIPQFNKGNQTLGMLGGGPTFGTANTKMTQFNNGLNTKIDILDESHLTDYSGDWSKVDLVQAGSINTINDLRALPAGKGPTKIFGEITMSTSPNMFWVKANTNQNDLKPLIDAGYVRAVKAGNQEYFVMDSDKASILVQGAVDDKKFNDPSIGININYKINFGFPNSSGGRNSAAQLLACEFYGCNQMITPEEYVSDPKFKAALIALYERSGKQAADEYSVDYCYNWLNANTTAVHISVFPESCFGAWMLSWSDSQKVIAKERGNVGIYVKDTVVHTFTLIATSEAGKAYIDTLTQKANVEKFSQVVTESTGMRGAGLASVPPVTLALFIASNEPYSPTTFPFGKLVSAIKKDLNDYGK